MEPYPETHFVVVQTEPFNIEVVSRPTPKLATPGDAIVRIEQSCLCGSDSHIYRGAQKGPYGYVMGHEFIGTLVQVGDDVQHFKVGERVVSPFTTSCGSCFFCDRGLTCRCVQSQLFGCRTLDGAQAEYVRVPLADTTLFPAPKDIDDDLLILMADVWPTGWYAAKTAYGMLNEIERVDAVAVVIGCGPVGLCTITAASKRFKTVYAIDSVSERLEQAKSHGAIPLNLHSDPHAAILAGTGGRGADAVLEIVGSPPALLLAIDLARVGGVVVSCGVHTHDVVMPGATLYNKNLRFSFGRCPVRAVFAESLETLRSVSKETPELMKHFIQKKVPLKDAPEYYRLFNEQAVGKTAFIGTGM